MKGAKKKKKDLWVNFNKDSSGESKEPLRLEVKFE
jgi:hypothetical protein